MESCLQRWCQQNILIFSNQCATHLYKVVQQFLTMFPELRKAPLYIAGESYAGRYIPALATKILEQDIELGPLDVNLQVRSEALSISMTFLYC